MPLKHASSPHNNNHNNKMTDQELQEIIQKLESSINEEDAYFGVHRYGD